VEERIVWPYVPPLDELDDDDDDDELELDDELEVPQQVN
jgi:hypothetical protein